LTACPCTEGERPAHYREAVLPESFNPSLRSPIFFGYNLTTAEEEIAAKEAEGKAVVRRQQVIWKYPYRRNMFYWNIPTDGICCTGISLPTEYLMLEYPY
jgi:hypothetical protein